MPIQGTPFHRLAATGLLLLLTACVDRSPVENMPERTLSGIRSQSVEEIEESEKARIAARQEAEQTIYDSLKVEWQRVLDDTTGAYDGTLVCDPLQYTATVAIVGPDGGDVNFGPHTLRIPAGALTQRTVITAEAPTSLQVASVFSPHGTVFAEGHLPELELSYKHCRGPVHRDARIAYVDSAGRIVEWPPSRDDREEAIVRAWIGHFSGYIVAY